MALGRASIPDWRDAAAYAPLLAADRTVFAWEWLRRNPAYRAAAMTLAGSLGAALAWGLHRFEDPNTPAPLARPFWTAQACDAVLRAEAVPVRGTPACDLGKVARLLSSHPDPGGGERLLLSDGWRTIRLDLTAGSASSGPTTWRFALAGPPFLPQLAALHHFDALMREGRFVQGHHPPVPRARRLLMVMRTADALAVGASQREIAAELIHIEALESSWREKRPDLRLQAQRLVRDARAQLAGGYRAFLGRP